MAHIETKQIPNWVYRVSIVAFPIAAISAIVTTVVIGVPNFTILGLYLAVPSVIAPVVVWRSQARVHERITALGTIDWRIVSILFHSILIGLIYVVVTADVRPMGFYVGVAAMYTLTFVLAMTADGKLKRTICLYHAAVALLVVIFSVTLNYDLFIGRTDLPAHISLATTIIETGQTAVENETYEPFLLWHVFTAGTYHLSGGWVSPQTVMFLLSGFIFAAGVPTLYTFAHRIYPDKRVALISCVMMLCVPLYVFYGMYSIPRSVTSLLLLFLLLSLMIRPSPQMRVLSLLFIVGIIVYHPVTIPFVLVILLALYLVERALGSQKPIVDGFTLVAATAITGVYWTLQAGALVDRLVETMILVISGDDSTADPAGIELNPWAEVANYLPYSFLALFVFLGFLFWYQDEALTKPTFASIGLLTIALLPFVFPGPALLLDPIVGINIDRFNQYGFMFVALTAGFGVTELLRRGGPLTVLLVLVLVSGLAFTAVSNDFVASDNPLVERPFYTYYLTDHEQASFEQLESVHDETIATDWPACRYLTELGSADCERAIVDAETGTFADHESILIREHEHEQRPLQFSQYVYADEMGESGLTERDRVYDSGAVTLHT